MERCRKRFLTVFCNHVRLFEEANSMAHRAKKIYLAVSDDDETTALPPPPVSAGLRDFTQPWLDLNDKSVLVTGGTGSFGRHFLKTVASRYRPRRPVIFSRDELKQSEM